MSSFLFQVWNFILESQEQQSNERLIMKCTNLIEQDNDDNQDSKKKKKKIELEHVFPRLVLFFYSFSKWNDYKKWTKWSST